MKPMNLRAMLLPLSFDLTGKKILLVGGGRAALEKFAQLSRTPCDLAIVSPEFNAEMEADISQPHNARITVARRPFQPGDITGCFMVFTAVDDRTVSKEIYDLCKAQKILINSADDKEYCDFYTNAIVERGSVQLSVSTGGRFAGLAAILRRHLESLFPAELDGEWEKVFALRERAVALQSVSEKKSVIANIVQEIEARYFKKEETK
jgi:precorrin-2 dehydrogenase / sirohydrochlorin ferrochelatase